MSIAMLLDMAKDACDERVAIGSKHGGGLSFAELAEAAAGGAAVLTASGATRVAFVGVNGGTFPVLLFSCAIAGIPLAPLNYRLAQDQLHELVGELDKPYVVADEAYLPMLEGAATAEVVESQAFLAQARSATPAEPVDVDDESTAVLLFTSGTTSKPKKVVLRHSNLVSYVLQTVEFASADEDQAVLVSVPPYHIAGVGTVLTNLYAGRRLAYLPNFDAAAWLDTVRTEQISNAMLVPTMLVRIVEELAGKPSELPHLTSIAYGGARMPAGVLESALEAFPSTGFVNAYGLTETSSTIAVLGPDDHRDALASDDPLVRARLGSAGRPVPGIEMEIRDEVGSPVPIGTPGELWVRGAQVSGEYEGLGSVLDAAGWFPTKDAAYQDPDGFLFIIGRSDDTIIRGGENIAPAEIEDCLGRHPGVRDVAVFGAPDDEWGERIVAAVVAQPGEALVPEELRAYVRERLRGSRTPDEVIVREELPYTQTGKLLRKQLASDILASR
jgi:acyl-CoA synthetase (AMP-forming)/AMP-acid ligase II